MPCLQILSFCPTTTRWLSQTSSTELRTTQLSTSPTTSVSSPGIMDILTTPGGCRTRTTNQAGLTNISVTRLDNLHLRLKCQKSTTLSGNSCCAPTYNGPFAPSFMLRTPAQTSTLLIMLCRDFSSTKDGRALLIYNYFLRKLLFSHYQHILLVGFSFIIYIFYCGSYIYISSYCSSTKLENFMIRQN